MQLSARSAAEVDSGQAGRQAGRTKTTQYSTEQYVHNINAKVLHYIQIFVVRGTYGNCAPCSIRVCYNKDSLDTVEFLHNDIQAE